MPNPLVGASALYENPEATLEHLAGLKAELSHDNGFDEAHLHFENALQIMAATPEEDRKTMDYLTQVARITRDDGFTYVREAIAFSLPGLLSHAEVVIGNARDITADIASGKEIGWAVMPNHQTVKHARRELKTEHSATIGLLGRLATVKGVLVGIDPTDSNPISRRLRDIDQQAYGVAHDELRHGTNGYYRVNNAMCCARQELLNNRRIHSAVWVGRALHGLAWTLFNDQKNLLRTGGSLLVRGWHLRSRQAAYDSVLQMP